MELAVQRQAFGQRAEREGILTPVLRVSQAALRWQETTQVLGLAGFAQAQAAVVQKLGSLGLFPVNVLGHIRVVRVHNDNQAGPRFSGCSLERTLLKPRLNLQL